MALLRSGFFKILLVFCLLFAGCMTSDQLVLSKSANVKQDLAKAVLIEAGIDKKYDLYLGNSLDLGMSPEAAKKPKFMAWMQALLVREAGWKYVETQYVNQLAANFSEAELRGLLSLSKQPLMKKLLQNEMKAYTNTAEQRRKLLFKVWDDYNSGLFNPPPEVLKEANP